MVRAHFLNNQLNYILLLCCLVTRIFTSIHYIEDIDSLRFAYSVIDEYNILKLQPHFPGYPIFCLLANILYEIIGNLGIVFSIIGGLSTFIIIYFTLKILKIDFSSKMGIIVVLLLFFNPMIWLMGNRYMPDLMGLAIFIASFYMLLKVDAKSNFLGIFLFGILLGTRLSYFPLLLFPIILLLKRNNRWLLLSLPGLLGVFIWLLPLVQLMGFENLYLAALRQTSGHFLDYGGTIITENNWIIRFKYLLNTIWSDGLGGYWANRSYITLFISIILLLLIISIFKNFKYIINKNSNIKYLIISTLLYLIWVLLFQNIIYKSRHVMPLVFTLVIILSASAKFLFQNRYIFQRFILSGLILLLALITINLSIQHKNPTAIKKLSNFLKQKNDNKIIVSIPLINYYLKSQNIKGEFIDVEINSEKKILNLINKEQPIFIIGNFVDKVNGYNAISDTSFYHNPYVNRMWASINLFSNQKL